MLWNFLCTFQRCTFLQCAATHPIIVLSLKCHPCSVKGPCQCVWWALQMSDRRLSGEKKTWYREMPFVSKWRRWRFLDSTDQLNKCLVHSPAPWKARRKCQAVGQCPCLTSLLLSSLHSLHQVAPEQLFRSYHGWQIDAPPQISMCPTTLTYLSITLRQNGKAMPWSELILRTKWTRF